MIDWIASVPLASLETNELDIEVDNLLSADLQLFDNLLSNAAFASYLLAYDTADAEHRETLRRAGITIEFAEDDDDEQKKKPTKKKKKWRIKQYEPNEADEIGAEITDGKNAPFGLRFDVPPQEAIDFFKRKQVLPPDEFYRLDGEAKAGAFSVSRVYRTDLIEGFKNELVDALEKGRTTDQVINRLRSILDGAGHKQLSTNHLETVVRTTMQMAYGVGRRMAQEEVKDLLPVWEYSAVGDDRTRPTHMALDGLQYSADHIFWSKYYPPWDFRCRCTVIPVLDYRKGYDRSRPNDRTVINYDGDGLPTGANVDGTPMNFKAPKFAGVPSGATIERTLKNAAQRALDERNK